MILSIVLCRDNIFALKMPRLRLSDIILGCIFLMHKKKHGRVVGLIIRIEGYM